jgi:hypothetical protein
LARRSRNQPAFACVATAVKNFRLQILDFRLAGGILLLKTPNNAQKKQDVDG